MTREQSLHSGQKGPQMTTMKIFQEVWVLYWLSLHAACIMCGLCGMQRQHVRETGSQKTTRCGSGSAEDKKWRHQIRREKGWGLGGHTAAGVWPPDVKSLAERRVLMFRVSQGSDLLSGRNAARFHNRQDCTKPRHRESKTLSAVCTFLCTAGCFKTRVGSQQRGKRPTLSWKAWGRQYQMNSYTGVAAFREWASYGLCCDPTFLCAMIMTREGGVHPRHLTMLYRRTCNLPLVCLNTISVLLRRSVSLLA